ncbi:hypothetical protein TGPRC2_362870, partial [Toxoplasma gondii TgCatPRC2]
MQRHRGQTTEKDARREDGENVETPHGEETGRRQTDSCPPAAEHSGEKGGRKASQTKREKHWRKKDMREQQPPPRTSNVSPGGQKEPKPTPNLEENKSERFSVSAEEQLSTVAEMQWRSEETRRKSHHTRAVKTQLEESSTGLCDLKKNESSEKDGGADDSPRRDP